MLVAEILKGKGHEVWSVSPDIPLTEACIELQRRGVGAVIVCQADKVVGVLSERDVVRAVAQHGVSALERPVSQHMTSDVVFAAPAESVSVLMQRMTDRRIRHLPVLSEGRLDGVISIGDVVKCQIDEATREAESLRSYIGAG
jgi:CBS domain-containing protein